MIQLKLHNEKEAVDIKWEIVLEKNVYLFVNINCTGGIRLFVSIGQSSFTIHDVFVFGTFSIHQVSTKSHERKGKRIAQDLHI